MSGGTYNFGKDDSNNDVSASVPYGTGVALVKYSSLGIPQWAKASTSNNAAFYSIAVDSSGNIYAAGSLIGTSDFGNLITASSPNSNGVLLVKYDSSGLAQWAKSVDGWYSSSLFRSVVIDSSGNVYTVGYTYTSNSSADYDFGNGVVLHAINPGSDYYGVLLVGYDASTGNTKFAKGVSGGRESMFLGVAIDPSSNIYAVGEMSYTNTYDFGKGVKVGGNATTDTLLVKYTYTP